MSFDIFVQSFAKGQPRDFDRRIVCDAFAQHIARSDEYGFSLLYQDGSQSFLYIDDTPAIDGFSVNRPAWNREFWQEIVTVLKASDSMLYWPGRGCVATSPAVEDELPLSMRDALGDPTVTEDVDRRS